MWVGLFPVVFPEMFPGKTGPYNMLVIDREKAQEFRLLLKKGAQEEALALATGLFRTYLAGEKLEEASQALILMGHILEIAGRSRVVEKEAQKLRALAIRKNTLRPYMGFMHARFENLLDLGDMKKAAAIVREMEEMGWRNIATLSRAEMAIVRGQPALARDLTEEYGINDPSSFLIKARSLAGTGRLAEAMGFLEGQAVKIPAFEIMRKDLVGFCLTALGEHGQAARHLNQAIEDARRAHGEAWGIASCFASLGVIWAARGDTEKARLYLDLGEGSSLRAGRIRETLEIRAIREAALPEGVDSLNRVREIAEEARARGFGVARTWALWAATGVAGTLGLEKEWRDHITTLMRLVREFELWGYLSYIAQAAPGPLSRALSVYPGDTRLKEIADRARGLSEIEKVRLCLMGRPTLELPRGRVPLEKGRATELLVYFALHGKGELTRQGIIQEFWPRLSEERARRNYYKFTALARSVLRKNGVMVKSHKSRDSAWIGCEVHTDLDELRNLVNAARAVEASATLDAARPIYERALLLISGSFLEGWGTTRLDFLEETRREAEDLIALVRVRMAGYLLDEDPEESLSLAQSVLSVHPFSEDACEIAIGALVRLGRPERARKLHDDFVERFRTELNLESRLTWPPG